MIPKAPSSSYIVWFYCAESRISAHKMHIEWINSLQENVSYRAVISEK